MIILICLPNVTQWEAWYTTKIMFLSVHIQKLLPFIPLKWVFIWCILRPFDAFLGPFFGYLPGEINGIIDVTWDWPGRTAYSSELIQIILQSELREYWKGCSIDDGK